MHKFKYKASIKSFVIHDFLFPKNIHFLMILSLKVKAKEILKCTLSNSQNVPEQRR